VNVAGVLRQKRSAEQTAKDNPWAARMARIGILSRGVIHLLGSISEVRWPPWCANRWDGC
jgi:hypothetical protein